MSELTELLERVEKATGPDQELDLMLMGVWSDVAARLTLPVAVAAPAWETPAYTASIDASLALVERVLPAANCTGFDKTPFGVDAYVSRNNVSEGHWYVEAHAPTAPLAILAALLKALISQAIQPPSKTGERR